MFGWVIVFFFMAIVAAVLGFTGLAGTFASIAQFLAVLFVIMFIASLAYSFISDESIYPPL